MSKKIKNDSNVTTVNDIEKAPIEEMKKRIRFGGRQKGSQNKITSRTKEIIANLLADYEESGLMADDFLALEPKERISIAEKLFGYNVPKMQAVAVDLNATDSKITIEHQLKDLSIEPDER